MICQICKNKDEFLSMLIDEEVDSYPHLATYAVHTLPRVCVYICDEEVEMLINSLDDMGIRYWLRDLT